MARSLLFATTNHIERLDPALSRPGRMDVWVNFANATKWQAKGIFKCFFPYKASSEGKEGETGSATTEKNLPLPRRKSAAPNIPLLSEDELNDLAERFSAAIPEDELSVCSLRSNFIWLTYINRFHRLQVCKGIYSRTKPAHASASTKFMNGLSRSVRPGPN